MLPSESADALTCDFAPLFLLSRLFLAPAPAPVVREDPADADTRAAALSTVRCDGSDVLARGGENDEGGEECSHERVVAPVQIYNRRPTARSSEKSRGERLGEVLDLRRTRLQPLTGGIASSACRKSSPGDYVAGQISICWAHGFRDHGLLKDIRAPHPRRHLRKRGMELC